MSAPSIWWAVPNQPSRWFSDEQLKVSASYHRPLRRAALLREALRVAGLVFLWFVLSQHEGNVQQQDGFASMLLAAVGVGFVWWVVDSATDIWFEYRHAPRFAVADAERPRSPVPLPRSAFAVGLVFGAISRVAVAVGLIAIAVGGERSPMAWYGVIGLVAAGATLIEGLGSTATGLRFHGAKKVEDERRRSLALEVGTLDDDLLVASAHNSHEGHNAFVAGWGSKRALVLTKDLWAAESDIRAHVVRHELAHLRRHHIVGAAIGSAVVELSVIVLVGLSLSRLDVVPDQKAAVPLLALGFLAIRLVAGLLLGWASRSRERRADLDAIREFPTPLVALRQIYVTDRADLDPPRWVQLLAEHPTPAERLTLFARS